jgi:lauroyl/myristoyl acyltransferase
MDNMKKKEIVDRIKNYFTSPAGGRRIPYRLGSYIIWWFSGTRYARQTYFKRKVHLIETFLQETGIRESSPALIREMISAFSMKKWRIMAISNLGERRFRKYVFFDNLEAFERSYGNGKGVIILSSHFGLTEVSISAFPRIGYHDFYTVVGAQGADSEKFTGINKNIESKTLVFDNFSDAELFRLMMSAKHTLNEGGIVHLLGDGYHGKSSISFTFINKVRGFRPSYAELALSTGADVIPIFITPGKHHRIQIELCNPLDKGTESMKREERSAHIVEQYVHLLERKWRESPQFINWGHMEKYLHHVPKQ